MSDLSEEIRTWLSSLDGYSFNKIEQVSSDASFRNYFRAIDDEKGVIHCHGFGSQFGE